MTAISRSSLEDWWCVNDEDGNNDSWEIDELKTEVTTSIIFEILDLLASVKNIGVRIIIQSLKWITDSIQALDPSKIRAFLVLIRINNSSSSTEKSSDTFQ